MARHARLSEFVPMFTATALLGTALLVAPYGVPVPDSRDIPNGLRDEFRQKQVRELARIEDDLAFVRSMIDISREWAGTTTEPLQDSKAAAGALAHVARWKEHEAKLVKEKRKLMRSWIP
jgi:hypothetical protein